MPVPIDLPAPAGTIGAGPSDRDIVTVDALDKRPYYDGPSDPERFPPYRGPRGTPARPRGGHFAYLQPSGSDRATVLRRAGLRDGSLHAHRVGALSRPAGALVFPPAFPRLEVIPRTRSGTAYSRPGYIECGYERGRTRQRRYPLGENFDVVAHETGHLIQRSVIGHPEHVEGLEQRAREEAFADLGGDRGAPARRGRRWPACWTARGAISSRPTCCPGSAR